jgi:hypothetical protein
MPCGWGNKLSVFPAISLIVEYRNEELRKQVRPDNCYICNYRYILYLAS